MAACFLRAVQGGLVGKGLIGQSLCCGTVDSPLVALDGDYLMPNNDGLACNSSFNNF